MRADHDCPQFKMGFDRGFFAGMSIGIFAAVLIYTFAPAIDHLVK